MKPKRLRTGWLGLVYLTLAVLTLANGGCLWIAAGVAGGAAVGYAYINGKVCQTFNARFDDAWAAARTGLVELGMPLVSEDRESIDCGCIESRTADGERVRIQVESVASKFPADGPLTRIGVRVATFGDHPVSYRLLDQIGAHLVVAPPSGLAAPVVIQPGPAAPPPPTAPPMLGPPRPVVPAPTAGLPPQTAAPPLAN